MRKSAIENCAISGIKLDLRDVASASPGRHRRAKIVTLRHAYPEGADGRIWDGVRAALWRGARDLFRADAYLDRVEVWSRRRVWQVLDIERDEAI